MNRRAVAAWALAVLALLLAQNTASRHALEHSGHRHVEHSSHSADQAHADQAHAGHAHADHAPTDHADHDAWGHPAQSASCALLDHLLVGQAGAGADLALAHPLLAQAPVLAPLLAPRLQQPWRAYQARGPPCA